MWISSVFISLLAIVGTEVYADDEVCGPTTLSADSNLATLVVSEPILNRDAPCVYTINGVTGKFVKIEFQQSKVVRENPACAAPFVKLEGVTGGVKTEIATICKTNDYKTYYWPASQVILTIQGKKSHGAQTFNVTYQSDASVSDVCGQTTLAADTSTQNQLEAPKAALQVNQICIYTINANPGEVVEIKFEKVAEKPTDPPILEKAPAASDTPKTLIRLDNLKNGVLTLIANIPPGEQQNLTHKSIDETLMITLFGSTGLSDKLFTAVYKSVTDPYCGPVALQAKEQPTLDWKFPAQTLTSARDCTYKIQAAADQTVQLNITALNFDTQTKTNECFPPYLELENFGGVTNTPIENVCDKTVPRTISSTGPTMIVKLHGVDKLMQHAVIATYTAVKVNTCGVVPGEAKEEKQSIDVYTKDDNIPSTHQCEWTIRAPEDKKVDIYLNTEEGSSKEQCVDVVIPEEKSPEHICRKVGNDKVTSGQPVTVKFPGPGENVYKNFEIYYKISAANNMLLPFSSFLITALLCFSQ